MRWTKWPHCPTCAKPLRVDPLGDLYCGQETCSMYRRVAGHADESTRRNACAVLGCGRSVMDPVHDPKTLDHPYER